MLQSMRRLAAQLAAPAGAVAPVSVLDCAERLGPRDVVVLEDALHAGVRGGLQRIGGRWVIILNCGDRRRRARFTLAHELGHMVLQDAGADGRAVFGAPVREALCDAFAAELLMPAVLVRTEWRRLRREGRASVAAIAGRFDVSVAAAGWRLRGLGLVG